MTTLAQMTDIAIAEANAYVRNQDSLTVLTADLGEGGLSFTVDDASAISRGTVEIGSELVYVKQVDKTYGTVTVIPSGRGWMATTDRWHPANTLVRNNPLFPRSMVMRYINEIIQSVDLFAVNNYEFEFNGSQFAWQLPTDALHVTSVTWQRPDSTGIWEPIKRWYMDRNYRGDDNGVPRTMKALVLNEAPMPGATVRVQYLGDPIIMQDSVENVFIDTGLPERAMDVVRYGALWKMLSSVDPGKVNAVSVNADAIDTKNDSGKATNVARYMYQMYQIRLGEEKQRQSDEFQPTINYTR